ncbi:MAG: metallo-beta-lactamase family protein [Myxococcota bacterium]|jgi:metallo-beta-lactamase family protein
MSRSKGPTITFLGAAETVTGSRYLVEADGAKVLVDCGLFQGIKSNRERNWKGLPFDVTSLDAVILTHAHIDHSGYVPRLRTLGYLGPVYCTPGTQDLLKILLPDAGYLQEEQARRANHYGYTRHRPAHPLYTQAAAKLSLTQLKPVPFRETFEPAANMSATFTRAGHIVGSACLTLTVAGKRLAFTGDVGRPSDPIMKPADPLGAADFLITESTYGDRRHPPEDVMAVLEQVVNGAADRGGIVLVPAFAVGRSQHLLHLVAELKTTDRIPDLPVYLDSPMAIAATRTFQQHSEDHKLSAAACERLGSAATFVRTADESKAVMRQPGSRIVIAASGMATGGRVMHHLEQVLPVRKNTVLFVGYQAAGTRGRSLVDGADDVKIHGAYVPVRARMVQVDGLSAHADYHEMIEWLARSPMKPRRVFVTHGEPAQADAFRRRLTDTFGWNAVVPHQGSRWDLV